MTTFVLEARIACIYCGGTLVVQVSNAFVYDYEISAKVVVPAECSECGKQFNVDMNYNAKVRVHSV
jgi:DNA-directed RNA polymerase subunit RPC12/RpoP